jgi:hypothetical protein
LLAGENFIHGFSNQQPRNKLHALGVELPDERATALAA